MRINNVRASAPMATISHAAFRVLLEELGGCDLYFSEMINASSLLAGGVFESYYLAPDPRPDKLVHQLVGGEADCVAQAAALLDGMPGFGIDLNMGCSAPEIVRAGGGVCWMRSIEGARRLVAQTRERVKSKRLSVKLRLGEREDPEYLIAFCEALRKEGVDFLTLHPRTRKDKFGRFARWDYVKLLKENLTLPVIGNGDVRTWEDFQRVQRDYQPDGVMVGRELVRSPWLFAYFRRKERWAKEEMESNELPSRPDFTFPVDLRNIAFRFLELLPQHQPPQFLESRAKRFFQYFSQNLRYGHWLLSALWNASSWKEIPVLVEDYFQEHPEEAIRILS